MALHEIGFEEKPRLTGAGTADDKHILVPRCLGVLWAAVHCQPFRLREDDVVAKDRVDIGPNVLRRAPESRLSTANFLYGRKYNHVEK